MANEPIVKWWLRIDSNIVFIVLSSNSGRVKIWNLLCNRYVITFLPPPGNPIAEISVVSTIFLNACVDLVNLYSYHHSSLIYDLSSSRTGIAPNLSFPTRLRSSIKMRHLVPNLGPYVFFLILCS